MIIVMSPTATPDQVDQVIRRIEEKGFKAHPSAGQDRTVIGVIGSNVYAVEDAFTHIPGVAEVVRISKPFKLSGREFKPEPSVLEVGPVRIGPGTVTVMAGPCSVETESMVMDTARAVRAAGAQVLRGGAFKPRTSPYSFQGLGKVGLEYLRRAADQEGMLVVTEVLHVGDLELVAEYSDILQIGARNMQNYTLLQEAGMSGRPVLLKRGLSSTIEEWLLAAEYILSKGNYRVILCERGIRTFETYTRNTLDLSAVPLVRELSHLPVVVDPSHGTGRWSLVTPMAAAAIAAGADGLMVEVHPNPEEALSDGPQSLTFKNFDALMGQVREVARVVGRSVE
ncbi:MAG: 3-deoxy-7-phosphoheptulonate synthase [Candidatus Dormibacteria bacterium]